ncbi:MAG: translation elongation factor Ts [Syntrophomonadaceae bacterium]|jgi:elongation factor Ts|nr:translation elongation factor Ts [Syntrophomonadaceae bacterium]MDH7498340.1 translation elongation factor Ts [Syntrophomonadaceae bacterium]
MTITSAMVKELRERTGVGMMDCKNALVETGGDMEKAIEVLRTRGLAKAAKKAGRIASEGLVEAYIHMGARLGVLVEVNCETDFVARTEEFKQLCRDIAMQIAAAKPEYVRREEILASVIAAEERILREQALQEGKPEKIVDKMVAGRIEKFYQEACLLEQNFIRDPEKKVIDVIHEAIAKLGENINVRRFARFEVGEGIDKTACEE